MKTLFALVLLVTIAGCADLSPVGDTAEFNKFVLLSSTIGPIDAGIVPALEQAFERETGIKVRHVGAGTSAALDIGRQGSADLVLAHAKALEEQFVAEGYGARRIPLMYNDFVIVGPADDPARIKGMPSATEAVKTIAASKARFVSRGDKSGTHVAELQVWEKAGVKPQGDWYQVWEKGSTGNAPTLKFANEGRAYTLIDRATFLTLQKHITLSIMVENDPILLNYMSLIPVNSAKFPRVNGKAAEIFVAWLTDPAKGQLLIRDFGKDKWGAPLFFPNSEEWSRQNFR